MNTSLKLFYWFKVKNGNIGFMLSCYDAELSYDSSTDTFKARYGNPSNIMGEHVIAHTVILMIEHMHSSIVSLFSS